MWAVTRKNNQAHAGEPQHEAAEEQAMHELRGAAGQLGGNFKPGMIYDPFDSQVAVTGRMKKPLIRIRDVAFRREFTDQERFAAL